MSFVNLWIAIPEDDHNGLNNRRGTANNVGPARDFVNGQLDPEVVQPMFATHQQGQTVRHLWSVILGEDTIPHSVNEFRQEFPGCQVLGCWKPDGAMLGCELVVTEVPNPAYTGEPYYITVDEDGIPVQVVNPAYVPQFLLQRSQIGTPQYEVSDQLINYMPGVDLEDINLPAGWQPRVFA